MKLVAFNILKLVCYPIVLTAAVRHGMEQFFGATKRKFQCDDRFGEESVVQVAEADVTIMLDGLEQAAEVTRPVRIIPLRVRGEHVAGLLHDAFEKVDG